jgi:hypothetical protein
VGEKYESRLKMVTKGFRNRNSMQPMGGGGDFFGLSFTLVTYITSLKKEITTYLFYFRTTQTSIFFLWANQRLNFQACKRLSGSKYLEISNISNYSHLKSAHVFYGDFSTSLESIRRIICFSV